MFRGRKANGDPLSVRAYDHEPDYELINRFLIDIYRPGAQLRNWLQPRWEYMHFHSLAIGLPFDRFGLLEDDGELVGLVHFEHHPAFNYLQIRPGYEGRASCLFDWADVHLGAESIPFGRKVLGVYVDERDTHLEELAAGCGFVEQDRFAEAHSSFRIDRPIPEPSLPAGFQIQSLDDDNDLHKINRVLWRGFNHEGPPPDEEIPGRELAQRAPNFRKDLTITVRAPNGDYAAFVGIWVVAESRVAYVEPVATDPSYRRMGLARAAVLEGVRRAGVEGADVAWVGSDQQFYLSMGFKIEARSRLWVKPLE